MSRLELREYPLRRSFPPTVSADKSFRISWPEREASRRIEAQEEDVLSLGQIKAALRALKAHDYEAWLAVVLVDVQRQSQAEASGRLNTHPRHLRRLIDEGWSLIAETLGNARPITGSSRA